MSKLELSITRNFWQKVFKLINVLLVTGIYVAVWDYKYRPQEINFPEIYAYILMYILFAYIYILYVRLYDGFLLHSSRIYELICGQMLSAVLSDAIMYIVIGLTTGRLHNPVPLMAAFAVQTAVIAAWSVTTHKWYFHFHLAQKAMFVVDEDYDVTEVTGEYGFSKHFDVAAVMTPQELIDSDLEALTDVSQIFVKCPAGEMRNKVMEACVKSGKVIYIIPELEDVFLHGAKQDHMYHAVMMRADKGEKYIGYDLIKRLFDLAASFLALVALSPVFAAVAVAIKLEDGGPVFYRQRRLTIHGHCFDIYKFRSMRVNAESDGVARLSSGENDPRITKTGRFIRKVRLDELPQLINILKGDMSIVGPRPERPELAAVYEESIPQFSQRLRVKAGLTGYAQVYGKYNTTPLNKLLMDMVYIERRSIREDIRIIFATLKTVFMPDSTEGVAADQTTALKDKKRSPVQ